MGLFNFKKDTADANVSTGNTNAVNTSDNLLNLNKNDILDLSKVDDTLVNIRVAAGWDVNKRGGRDYDLDLCAFLLNDKRKCIDTVYYGDKRTAGVSLDGDNLTGEGDGDDENIRVNFNKVASNVASIVFAVVIYSARERNQSFKNVNNAFVRLVNTDARDKEICRYQLTEDGGDNTAVTFAELYRTGNGWSFKAIGEYSCDTISSLENKY